MSNKNKEVTHKNILAAALKIFSHKGYADATIKEIHELAGCNALTVFRHFTDKENLFYSVVEAYKDIDVDFSAVNIEINPANPEESLMKLADVYFKALFENLDILRIFINECTTFPTLKASAWFIPPNMCRDFGERLGRAGLSQDMRNGELFVGYITKLCLEFNTHDRVWDYSDELLSTFSQKMKRQIVLTSDMLLWEKSRTLAVV